MTRSIILYNAVVVKQTAHISLSFPDRAHRERHDRVEPNSLAMVKYGVVPGTVTGTILQRQTLPLHAKRASSRAGPLPHTPFQTHSTPVGPIICCYDSIRLAAAGALIMKRFVLPSMDIESELQSPRPKSAERGEGWYWLMMVRDRFVRR